VEQQGYPNRRSAGEERILLYVAAGLPVAAARVGDPVEEAGSKMKVGLALGVEADAGRRGGQQRWRCG
jgi:hypothetical protein